MDSRIPVLNANPDVCIYAPEVYCGVEKQNWGGVGFARIFMFDHPSLWVSHWETKTPNKARQGQKRRTKSWTLGATRPIDSLSNALIRPFALVSSSHCKRVLSARAKPLCRATQKCTGNTCPLRLANFICGGGLHCILHEVDYTCVLHERQEGQRVGK